MAGGREEVATLALETVVEETLVMVQRAAA